MATRWASEGRPSAQEYESRWAELAAQGENPHGEADLVASFAPRRVLDAGCGTGRVARELHRRGIEVVGVDLDAGFIEHARHAAPQVEWHHADLADVQVGTDFDVVVAAGNVMIFLAPGTEATVVANLAAHLAPAGRLICGFQVESDSVLAAFDRDAAAAGLTLAQRFATWSGDEYTGGRYAVSIHVLSGSEGHLDH